MTIHARGCRSDEFPISIDRLLVIEQFVISRQLQLHEPATWFACRATLKQGLLANETAWFVPGNSKAQAGGQWIIVRADIMSPMAVTFLHAAGIHGVIASMGQIVCSAGGRQAVKYVKRQIRRNIKLPAQFTHVGNATCSHNGVADLNLL